VVLTELGFSDDEERVYRLLVGLRSAEPRDLADRAGLDAVAAEQVFAALTDKGLVAWSGARRRLVAAPPHIAGEVLLLDRAKKLQRARAQFAQLAEEYRGAVRETAAEEVIEIIPHGALAQRFEQLQRRARTEVVMVDAPPHFVPASQNDVEIERLAAGVSYRLLYARSVLELAGALEDVARYVRAGEQARVVDEAPLKVIIVDGEVAIAPALSSSDLTTASDCLLIHRSAVLDALVAFFELLWRQAVPYQHVFPSEDPSAGTATGLDPEQAQLLGLMLTGMTDDVIARQLGVGRRTVARRIRSLLDQAGVSSRIQLGWRSAHLGWLAAHPHTDRQRSGGAPVGIGD
jgi:sugar-specific transcriptional regulator TrmB/DNA-binding CsgD family transcriptional regulator